MSRKDELLHYTSRSSSRPLIPTFVFVFFLRFFFFFFFNDTATTEIYTLSLHDALPICTVSRRSACREWTGPAAGPGTPRLLLGHEPARWWMPRRAALHSRRFMRSE